VKIGTVSFIVHTGKPTARAMHDELVALVQERGVAVVDSDPELVISLGGDGTTLRAAHLAHEADAPLLGINLGSLGYLTEVEAGDQVHALERVLDGEFEVEHRMMLACDVRVEGTLQSSHVGLNEVLVERSARHRLVTLVVDVRGERLATFSADGVIVATPTGSTAYALSAGGPIVSPRAESLIVVPVSPHMIFSRAVVLAPDEIVEIEPKDDEPVASLSLDGAIGCELQPGSAVAVKRHPRPLQLIRMSGPGFLERLRTKMHLPS
jgi:NAD+ kinase